VNVNAAGQPQSYVIATGPITSSGRTFDVVVETSQGKLSDVSNVATIVPVEVPGRVVGLMATADQRRIVLEWNRPKENSDLVEAYVVTRTDIPAEPQTVTDTKYEDTRYQAGKEFTYHVTAVRRAGDRLVMGVGPETANVVAEDKKAPGVPTGIEFTQSVLTWEPNPESDLAGYRVFRSERADAGFKPVSESLITTNVFFDPAYRPGLYYAVSAVDESRNESAMSAPFRAP
jgi:fibronectin type 3 domain-containing protein